MNSREKKTLLDSLNRAPLPQAGTMGMMIFDPFWAEQDHRSSGAELIHVLRGNLTVRTAQEEWCANPGDTLLIPPETTHRDIFDVASGLDVFFCHFTWPAPPEYWTAVKPGTMQSADNTVRVEAAGTIDQLRSDLARHTGAEALLSSTRILTLLLLALQSVLEQDGNGEAEETADAQTSARRLALMRQARQYVEKHYAACISLDDIAAELDISSYYLSHIFSQESDFSLFAYLTRVRMQKAREHLLAGKRPIAAVAAAVGYRDANYFSKVFREQHGVAPRDYCTNRQT